MGRRVFSLELLGGIMTEASSRDVSIGDLLRENLLWALLWDGKTFWGGEEIFLEEFADGLKWRCGEG